MMTKSKPFDLVKWLMLAGMFVLSFCLFYLLTLRPSSDISIHATWAAEGNFRDLTTFVHHGAHPMWHVLVSLVMLTGISLEVSSALVTAVCKTAGVWLIHRLLTLGLEGRFHRHAITAFALICSLVSAVCVPFINPAVYAGAGTPNTWHSCTQLIAMVWMLLCVPYTARMYDHFTELEPQLGPHTILPWREPVTLGVMLLMSLLAKPTFMQAFLPAACLFFLWQWIRHPRSSRYFLQVLVCVLPSIAFMIVQYMYYFGIIVPWQASMVLEVSAEKFAVAILRVLLIQLFPLYTLWTFRKQKKDTCFWLTLVFNIAGIVEFIILGEDGRRTSDGNFGWGMMGASLMMWVVCLMTFLREKKTRLQLYTGSALLGWHLVSGVYYIGYLFFTGNVL